MKGHPLAKDKGKQEEDVDPYAGIASTGLRDDFDGLIESVEFTYDSDYNDGNSMIARVEVLDENFDDHDADFQEKFGDHEILKLSTGSGLEPADKGASAAMENGKTMKGFQRNCNFFLFFSSALALDGVLDELKKRGSPPMWDASALVGMRFHFDRFEYTPYNHDPAKQLPSRIQPTKFLGIGAGGGAKKKKKKDKSKSE